MRRSARMVGTSDALLMAVMEAEKGTNPPGVEPSALICAVTIAASAAVLQKKGAEYVQSTCPKRASTVSSSSRARRFTETVDPTAVVMTASASSWNTGRRCVATAATTSDLENGPALTTQLEHGSECAKRSVIAAPLAKASLDSTPPSPAVVSSADEVTARGKKTPVPPLAMPATAMGLVVDVVASEPTSQKDSVVGVPRSRNRGVNPMWIALDAAVVTVNVVPPALFFSMKEP
mmetsp:Transcript_37197/g.114890  ORF Transcript_37197/g.114890 Transcript_37197/m.114890 type:complete len:234 (-) Transcript_37197:84-785(-)